MKSVYEIRVTGKGQSAGCVNTFTALVESLKHREQEHGEMLVTYDEAVSIVKSRRVRTVFIRANQQAPSKDKPDHAYRATGSVEVKRREALRFLDSAYSRLKDRAMVEMSLHGNCLFIG